jgi:hypothetical protein
MTFPHLLQETADRLLKKCESTHPNPFNHGLDDLAGQHGDCKADQGSDLDFERDSSSAMAPLIGGAL